MDTRSNSQEFNEATQESAFYGKVDFIPTDQFKRKDATPGFCFIPRFRFRHCARIP